MQIFGDQNHQDQRVSGSGSPRAAANPAYYFGASGVSALAFFPLWKANLEEMGGLGWWVDGLVGEVVILFFLDAISFWGRGRLRKEVLMCFAHFLVVIKL